MTTNILSSAEVNFLMTSVGPALAGECVQLGYDFKASTKHVMAAMDAQITALKARREQLREQCRAKGIDC